MSISYGLKQATQYEKTNSLQHYELDVPMNPRFQNLSSVADLCHQLAKTGKSADYYLIDRFGAKFTLMLVTF
jgi:hypothetical protein